ncbi:MAG: acyl-CoA synthetase [Rhodospirillales bacterium]
MPIATLADVEAYEKTPLKTRLHGVENIYDMLSAVAQRHPDKPAIHYIATGTADDPVVTYTYKQFMRRITQSANLFRSLGAGPDDVVSLILPILPETFFCMWGSESAAIGNPINHYLEPAQIAGIMNEAKTKILITCDPSIVADIWPKIEKIRGQIPTLKAIVVIGGKPAPDVIRYEDVIEQQNGDTMPSPRNGKFADVAGLFHTGGTTGVPKLARHTQGGLLTHSLVNSNSLAVDEHDIFFNALPPFHVGGSTCGGLAPWSRGATVVMLTPLGMRNPLVGGNFWKLVERFRPTVVGMVPTIWGALLNVPSGGHDISSIRVTNCGGSTMPVEIANAVKRKLNVPIVEGYGMTEVHGFSTMNPIAGEQRIGSIGFHMPYCQLIVAELDGLKIKRRMPSNEQGAVLMRGPQIFGGYVSPLHNREAWIEAEPGDADHGKWLNSGDLGRIDAQNYVWLTGRAKDLIIRGGHNIDPIVIEEALHQHPEVESAAAIGRPDRHAGELPVAYVQLRPGAKVTGEELQSFVRERIPERAATPVEVTVVAQMPVTGVGKIFKPQLRLQAAQTIFARLLEPLKAEGIDTDVTVAPHREHGTLATVALKKAPDREQAKAKIKELLGGFQLRYEVV